METVIEQIFAVILLLIVVLAVYLHYTKNVIQITLFDDENDRFITIRFIKPDPPRGNLEA